MHTAVRLRSVLEEATPRLRSISEAEASRPLAPGGWSAREVVGHLVDSACNNHQRFVRAQFSSDLVFAGYDQDAWVAAQAYRESPWLELIDLWSLYNRHLARVMEVAPESVRRRAVRRHNLDEIAWAPVPSDTPATLDGFMADYVDHLEHHLRQILGEDWASRDPGTGSVEPGGAGSTRGETA